jgi:hypothetical protein
VLVAVVSRSMRPSASSARAVGDNTARRFEREVEQGLRQVEQAKPPTSVASEPAPAPVIEPPPLPPGMPDAHDSWKRQMRPQRTPCGRPSYKGATCRCRRVACSGQ